VSWEQFERIQRTISENLRGVENTGAAGSGAALVAGVLRCRRCVTGSYAAFLSGGAMSCRGERSGFAA
jgi:hypothetical protein